MKLKQKPTYLLSKIGALCGFVAILWGNHFNLTLDADKLALAGGLGTIGSMFENNAMLNNIFGIVCKLIGVTYTPPVDEDTIPTDQSVTTPK